MSSSIAFIGLGAMGSAMSLTLLRQGFTLTAFDISTQATSKFQSAAAEFPEIPASHAGVAASPAGASKNATICLFMVANQAHVESALLAPETGAIHTLSRGAVLLVCSTVSPTYITTLRSRLDSPEDLNRPDLILLDAPVSGGVARSATGTLTIMASSHKPEDLKRADVLAVLNALSDGGKNLYVIPGELGSGLKLKALNQVNCGINITAASEVMGCAAALGLDTQKFYGSITTTDESSGKRRERQGWTWMLANRGPRMLDPQLPMASATHIIVKDVGIILDEAQRMSCSLPLVSRAKAVLDQAMDQGLAGEDDSRVVDVYLGPERKDLVVQQGGNSSLSTSEHEELVQMLCVAHSCVQLQGAYETGIFAAALELDGPEQVEQWVRILGGAAGGSPVFDDAMKWAYGKANEESQARFADRFRDFALSSNGFEAAKKVKTLEGLVNFAESKKYEVTLMKEVLGWMSKELVR